VAEVSHAFTGPGDTKASLNKGELLKGELLASVATTTVEAESCKNSRRVFGDKSAVLYYGRMKCLTD
jgi:hypothetical protein